MSHLVDTNILTRVIVVKDPLSPVAQAAINILQQRRESLLVAPQNLMEFWAVATRPREAFNVDDFRRYPGITAVSPQSFSVPRTPPEQGGTTK